MSDASRAAQLRRLLFPQSIAVVGASAEFQKAGSQLVHALRDFPGALYPINRKTTEIQGFKAYPDLVSLPEAPDLVAVAVPAGATPMVIEEAARARAGGALVVGGGFAESGDAGAALQSASLAAALDGGVRLLGPNTSGYFSPAAGRYVTFAPGTETIRAGSVAVVAQSGGVNLTLSFMLSRAGLGVSLAVGLGNACDVGASDILPLLADDPDTSVIALHLEGVTFGRQLYDTLRAVTPRKPVVVLTVGRADSSAFAESHTGALLGSFDLKVAALRQAGAVVVDSTDSLVAACAGLSRRRLPAKADPGVALMTAQAGPGLLIVDNLRAAGVSVPDLTDASVQHIETLLPPITYMRNPVDTGRPSPAFPEILGTVATDPNVDLLCVWALNEPEVLDPAQALAAAASDKPLLFGGIGAAGAFDEVIEQVNAAGFAALASPEQLVTAARAMVEDARAQYAAQHDARQEGDAAAPVDLPDTIDEAAAKAILGDLGIRSPARILCATRADAHAARAQIGGRIVIKVIDAAILHKTEAGGVHVGVADADALDRALDCIDAIPGPQRAYLVEEMAPPGLELIVGAVRDPSFGPAIIVGLGGVAAEAMQDVSRRLSPITAQDAHAMLDELRGKALLDGWRGAPAIDRQAIVDVLVTLARFIADNPAVSEVEINPLRAYPDGCLALDALLVSRKV
ncbi:hypothetical protein C100_17900 [Sphingobium sp. C100]|uniref:acetate--CoA ligase family protein n=1 Tax=Sphingobium sp. C100 TaxID=1207055 RepID=UPI0003D5988F|nr:acetate--CoA ligase family protein [Sphingobium sp. C100]ETI61214.1 hypothetical protein C100_17900 [Sphingobium sp. C100]